MILLRRTLLAAASVSLVSLASGCDDSPQRSETAALNALDAAMPLIERDTAQIRDGMPKSLPVLAKRLPDDPLGKRQELQEAIKAARGNVDDLAHAKSTFFSFASPDGVVLRSEIDPDRLVDQNIVKTFPELAKALDPKAGLVEVYGEMDALRGVKKGDDIAWVVALGVPGAEGGDGKPRGLFLTGWSMRLYARSIEGQVRTKLTELAKEKGDKTVPLVYVYVVKGKGAYGDPDSPDSNGQKLVELDVVGKTQGGDFKTHLEIDGRVFGIAARRCKAFGDDAAVAVVASVY
ncbi:MAG TPA: hypothetical protein VL400_07640 [Polyangiaceae bacterium]|nr:hypothetical protein [Polyangiaceae bacterium]